MPTQVQFRRGTTTQNESFTGAVGELSVDTTLDTIRVHDGSTAGGIRLAKYSEIQSGDITAVVAGTGLSGGATSGSATVNLSHLGLESLSDPNDDQIIFWDDSAGATAFLDLGTGLSISGTTISVGTLNQDTTGNAATATALETARTIHGVSFDGTANIDLSEVVQDTVGAMFSSNTETGITVSYEDGDGTIDLVVGTLNQDTTGNAATATALETARNIGGVSFDGSANINLPGVNTSGTQDTSGNAATATALATARTINGVSFDGTANVTTLTAGTGVSVSGTAVSIGQAVATSDDVTFADIAATGNVTITGNLDVNGTTTTLDTTNSTIADRLIELGTGTSGTPANDMGIVLERGSSDNAFIGWDESADKFIMGTGSFTGASTGDLTITTGTLVANLEGNATGLTTAAITGLTEDSSPAEDDFLITFDTSASSLKKVQKSNIAAAVSFSVNDNMPLTLADASSDPIQFTNVGTSATSLTVTLADGSIDNIDIVATSNSATEFRDNDNDTKIQVEATSDDDTIKFTTAGTERLNISSTGVVDFKGNNLKAYSETKQAVTSSSGVITIDMSAGNTGAITLSENITDIDFTNVPTSGVSTFTLQITQDSSSRTVAINAVTVNGGSDVTAKTAGGAGYSVSTGNAAIDLITFLFVDAATPLLTVQQAFS